MRPICLAVTGAIAIAAGATSAFALSPKARIGHAGLGPIKIGMTEHQIERAGKRSIRLDSFPGSDCASAKLAGNTTGLFTGKRLRRIYIRTPVFATTAGIRVGSSEERVLAAYPGVLDRVPQHYVPDQDNLVLKKGRSKVVFSLTDGKVTEISAGRKPEIDYVEGCA
jgi:hypothetical protein